MTETPDSTNGNGHGFQSWWKILSYGAGAGAVLFGVLSGFWKIDARLEAQSNSLHELTLSVRAIADKSATAELVDAKIERACLEMALANNGRWHCPFAAVAVKAPPSRRWRPKVSVSKSSKRSK